MFSSLFVALFVLCAPVAASNSTIVCVAGQCMQGSSNTTLGISLSASDVASSVLLLPGQYTAATNPELVHDLLTSSHATLSPHPGFGNSSALALPLNVAVAPGLAIYAQTLYSGQAAFSALPSAPVVNGSTPLTAESMAISSSVWVALSFGTNGRVVLWDSVPDTAQLPLSSKGPMSLLDMQSSTCFPPCASSGTCSASGTCACAPGFYGTSCETCAAEFFGPTCQACPAGCASCDEGISGTGRCLTPPIANPLTACNCLNGECAPDGSCVCNPGWTTAANGTACAKCASGFFATSTGDCKVCELGCTSCADGTGNCLTCGTHFTQDQNDATKCITVPTTAACPDGSFSSDGTNCVACSASCSTCFGPTSNDCALCPNLHYLTNNGSCVIASSTGVCDGSNLIADNNKGRCDACGAKCTSCEIASFNVASTVNQLKCTGCLKGTVLSNGQCIDTCPTGTFLSPKDNVTCTACDSSCSTCSGSATSCLTCPTGQLALNGKCVNTCPSNTFSASGACLACHTDCATCSGPSFTQCASCPSNRPVLSSGRCLPTCSKAQFFDIASGTCQPCNGSCSSCSGSGPTNCLACSSASQVLRAGACTAATCNDSTSVVSGLGVCLSDLVIVKPIPSSPSVPAAVTASGSHQKTQTRAKVIGCSVSGISLLGLMSWYWRRYLRRCLCNRRAKQTAALAASKRLDPKKSWRWRLLRFGERFFGHKASRRASPPPPITTEDVESEVIKLRKMRSAEEALHHLEMEKLQLFGAYEYSHAGSVRSSSAPSSCSSHSHAPSTLPWLDGRRESDHHTSIAEQVSRASIYSQVTGEPRTAPEPRQPVNKNLLTALARYPSSVSSAGRSVSRASIYSQVTGELHTAPEPSQPVNKNLLTAPLFSENSYLTCNRLAESVLATTKRAKKVKSSSSTVQQEDQSDDEELPPAPRARTTRAHPPAPINDSEDEGKQPASAKRTVTGKTKPAAIAPKVKARLIADSASEASSVSQDSNSSGNDSDSDDNLSDGPMEITVEEVRIVDPVPKRGSGTSQNSAEDESPNVQCSGGVNLFRPDIAVEIHRSGPRHHRAPSTSSMHSFSSVPGTSVPDTYDDLIHTDRNSGGEDDPNSDGEDAFEDEAPPQRIPGKSSVITSSEDESEEALNIKPKKQNVNSRRHLLANDVDSVYRLIKMFAKQR
ncbi:hypothetical protein B0H19DRAFT_1188013 [Mycena capillaripes]|nr:hypothetical protein B0H19DRAFT_1188013 [Mycena capillaripes]